MPKQKRYVVREGKQKGIFSDRPSCQKAVSGYANAQYKSFSSQQEAIDAFASDYQQYVWHKTNGKVYTATQKQEIWLPVTSSLSVDAACSGNPGILEFRWVNTATSEVLFASNPYAQGTVNIGEFLALVKWLQYAQKHNISIIYSDSRTAMARAKKRQANTTLQPTDLNTPLFIQLDEAERRIQSVEFVVHDRAHKDNKKLAKDKQIHIIKRETDLRWEIPADYGRK